MILNMDFLISLVMDYIAQLQPFYEDGFGID